MLKIYHVRGTRSIRPIWLCYELNLPVDIETIDFSTPYRNSEEWRAISPTGKVPVLTDGPMTMFESGAMVDYILERYSEGRLCPETGTAEKAIHQQWCWFAEATLSRPVGFNRILKSHHEDVAILVEDAKWKFRKCLDALESALVDGEFILGTKFTAADIMIGSSLGFVDDLVDGKYPYARAYLDKLRTREACVRAMNA